MIIYAIDSSKSAKDLILYQKEFVLESAKQCITDHRLMGLIYYSSRATPVADLISNIEDLSELTENIVIMRGLPEPVRAVKEASEIIFNVKKGLVSSGDTIIVLWSMPKKPRIPVHFAKVLARSVGADLYIIGLQYTTPKWLRSLGYDIGVDIIYRRRLKSGDLARKIGCG